MSAVGLVTAHSLALDGSRRDQAMALARRNALTDAEVAHLEYLASARQPVDAARPETVPLTAADASETLEMLARARESGVRPPVRSRREGWR